MIWLNPIQINKTDCFLVLHSGWGSDYPPPSFQSSGVMWQSFKRCPVQNCFFFCCQSYLENSNWLTVVGLLDILEDPIKKRWTYLQPSGQGINWVTMWPTPWSTLKNAGELNRQYFSQIKSKLSITSTKKNQSQHLINQISNQTSQLPPNPWILLSTWLARIGLLSNNSPWSPLTSTLHNLVLGGSDYSVFAACLLYLHLVFFYQSSINLFTLISVLNSKNHPTQFCLFETIKSNLEQFNTSYN